MEARKVEPSNGWLWIKEGIEIFKKSPVLWVALTIVMALGLIAIASLPTVGDPLATLLMPVLLAGFMLGCRALQQGKALELAHLFAGFKVRTHQLIALGGINFVSQLLIMEVMKLAGGEKLVELIMGGVPMDDPNVLDQAVTDAGLSVFIGMPLYAVLVMAMQFAPALVLFNNAAPLDALKSSLQACLRNIMPLSVYGAIMMVFALIASIPMFLGWLVMLPLMIASTYTAYRDIFPAQQESVRAAESATAANGNQEENSPK
jgi:hypothetical protein